MGNNISFFNSKSKGLQEENEPETSKSENDGLEFTHEQLNMFIKMFEKDRVLTDFLIFDRCCVLADKYLLAMCFVYFVRAGLKPTEYRRLNFFSALYIAQSMEEDDYKLRRGLFPWASAPSIRIRRLPLLRTVNRMWVAMECRSVVSKFSCNQVIEVCPKAKIWLRNRPAHHGNAYRQFKKCSNCEPKSFNDILDFYEFDDDVYDDKPKLLKQALLEPDPNVSSVEDSSDESPLDESCSDSSDEHSDSQKSSDESSPHCDKFPNAALADGTENLTPDGVSANRAIDEPRQREYDFFVEDSYDGNDFDNNNNCNNSVK